MPICSKKLRKFNTGFLRPKKKSISSSMLSNSNYLGTICHIFFVGFSSASLSYVVD